MLASGYLSLLSRKDPLEVLSMTQPSERSQGLGSDGQNSKEDRAGQLQKHWAKRRPVCGLVIWRTGLNGDALSRRNIW